MTSQTDANDTLAALQAEATAMREHFAVIRFTPDGTILDANPAFCRAMGYGESEIRGRHHSMFVFPEEANTPAYKNLWRDLGNGVARPGRSRRRRKDGSPIWLQSVYAPVRDASGQVTQVIKYASDVSEQVQRDESMRVLMTEVGRVMRGLERGALGERVEGSFDGELGDVADAVNSTCDRLSQLTERLREASVAIQSHADTVAGGNKALAQRTEDQASFLEQTAANMEEMTQTVKQNAESAQRADSLSRVAQSTATEGGDVVNQAVAAMREINASSRQISDIISVIDEIAFQTNLLALNAAVEAARAGDQGRGFAVVASEVRNLAQRSASAAKDIKALIQDSLGKVDQGSRLVDQSGKTLESIVSSVREVSQLIGDIATASAEQSSGIEEISKAISHMDSMTQQNAALTEETTAASEAAMREVATLQELVEFFGGQSADGGRPGAAVPSAGAGAGGARVAGSPTGVERRGPGRPWAERSAGASATPAPRSGASAAAGGTSTFGASDDSWEEF